MKDLIGQALKDYYHHKEPEDLYTQTNISDRDVLPVAYLFRSIEDMPIIETTALSLCNGCVLDIGCGSGSHSLILQKQGLTVTAIDRSPGASEVAKRRGVDHAVCTDLLAFKGQTFDTILMLMNGTGIFETIEKLPEYMTHLKTLLNPGGQIVIDSSDLQYMSDQGPQGSIWVPADRYYGELEFKMMYKSIEGDYFPWLFIHAPLFESIAQKNGFDFKVVQEGEHFDYLAILTLVEMPLLD